MELAQKYVYNVWKYQSFSKAAKVLYVSQPSLSAVVAKLEGELGFQIFDRSVHPIITTAKGRVYIEYLLEIYEAEKMLRRQLTETDNIEQGRLDVGSYSFLAQCVFTEVCRHFKQKHPKFTLSLDMAATAERLRTKWIDLLLTYTPSDTEFVAVPLHEERLFVALHKDHPAATPLSDYALSAEEVISGAIRSEKEIVDPTLLTHVPFIKSLTLSDPDERLSRILKEYPTGCYTTKKGIDFDVKYRMAQRELGAIFVSDFYIKQMPRDRDQLLYFALRSPLSYRTSYLQYRKNADNQRVLDEFIEAALAYCRSESIPYPLKPTEQ
ncbi:MAG: LysR family transcriptional regulator [Ruminococcaceae bacterium]|nr:LysR family transcriptional regulator [Oscillospiraceae bacterium]